MTVLTQRFVLQGVHVLFDPVHIEPKHGHEYTLQVSVEAKVGVELLLQTVQELIVKPWDKKDWSKMGLLQATGELLVEKFDEILRHSGIGALLVAVVLKETRKNRFVSAKSLLLYCE
jgi:hypothetical protein